MNAEPPASQLAKSKKPWMDVRHIVFYFAIFGANAAIIGPWTIKVRTLPMVEAFYFMPAMFCCCIPLVIGVSLWERQWKLAGLSLILTIACILIYRLDPGSEKQFLTYFAETSSKRAAAVEWTRGQPARSWPPLALPSEFKGFTFKNEAYRYVKGDEEWVFLPMIRYGVDNENGFAWSKTGKPPTRESHPELVRYEALGQGWFRYWTT